MLDQVQTVLGPVGPSDLGITLPHEHVFIDLYRVSRDPNGRLRDATLAEAELKRFRDAGGTTLVDVTNEGLGRDPFALVQVAKATGLNIVMGSGWYRDPYYPPEIESRTTNDLADAIVTDIVRGAGSANVRSGVIGEIGSDREFISPREERVFRAAGRAHSQTDVTITTHAPFSEVGLAQLDLLAEEGVPPSRVIIGHADSHPDPDYHREIASRGAWVQFDRISGRFAVDRDRRVGNVLALAERGLLHRVLLSSDVCGQSDLAAYGGPGYEYAVGGFRAELAASGISRDDLELLYVINPRRALTGGD